MWFDKSILYCMLGRKLLEILFIVTPPAAVTGLALWSLPLGFPLGLFVGFAGPRWADYVHAKMWPGLC